MNAPRTLDDLVTPAALVDVARMTVNLDRMARYTTQHRLALYPHTKTHKTPELAQQQLNHGAAGVTVATLHEAEVMSDVCDNILLAYPPIGREKLRRLVVLAARTPVTVAVDSQEALAGLCNALRGTGARVSAFVEIDVGMRRVGVGAPDDAIALARTVSDAHDLDYAGLLFYPGHVRAPVLQQDEAIDATRATIGEFIAALTNAGLAPTRVSGGSTPTAFASHRFDAVTEIRPGTYIFNDRTTAEIGACEWTDCAYSVIATVVSTSVPGQAVVDAGAKALFREELRGAPAAGFGALLDHREVTVKALSEEHGLLDLTRTDWRPRIGDRVRIVPNHVCVSVNLHDTLWLERAGEIVGSYKIAARGW